MSHSFHPPQRILMGPGPSDVSARVLGALGRPTIGHLDPLFIELMDDTKQLLQYAFKTQNELTIPLSAPGSAGMEAAFVNLGLSGGHRHRLSKRGVRWPHERERRALRRSRCDGAGSMGRSR